MKKPREYTFIHCAFALCVLLCLTISVTCQNVAISPGKGFVNQQNAQTQQRTSPQQIGVNKLVVANHFNKRPLVFQCNDMVPLFSARRNIQPQFGNSPFLVSASTVQAIPGSYIKGALVRNRENRRVLVGYMCFFRCI